MKIDAECLQEILQCGPIVEYDEDFQLIITANGAYFNVFNLNGDCLDCFSRPRDFYETTAAKLLDEARELIRNMHEDRAEEEE